MDREKEICSELCKSVDAARESFNGIWNEMGVGKYSRIDRLNTICEHHQALLDSMIGEERRSLTRSKDIISEKTKEVDELCLALGRPFYKLKSGLSLLMQKDHILLLFKELLVSDDKDERIKSYKDLVDVEMELCDRIKAIPQIKLTQRKVPLLEELNKFKLRVKSLVMEVMKHHDTFSETRKQIFGLLSELEKIPQTGFEDDVINMEDSFLLSDSNMASLRCFHDLPREEKSNQIERHHFREDDGGLRALSRTRLAFLKVEVRSVTADAVTWPF